MAYRDLAALLDLTGYLCTAVDTYAVDLENAAPATRQELAQQCVDLSGCMSRLEAQLPHHAPASSLAMRIREAVSEAQAALASVSTS